MNFFLIAMAAISTSCDSSDSYTPALPDEPNPPIVIEKEQGIALTAGAAGSYKLSGQEVDIVLYGKNSIYGVCMKQPAVGHFLAEAEADVTDNFGLALVRVNNGKPDYNNFTSISVCRENGISVARVNDRQNGRTNVLDNTGVIGSNDLDFRYSLPFVGNEFSVPFDGSNGKVRILRNKISGFFHFYVGVSKTINGKYCENWMELAQSKDWNDDNTQYFVCPIARTTTNSSASVKFSNISIENLATADCVDDTFKVESRHYIWAGFPGQATVVSFDSKYNSALADNRKFVFWSEMNYVPAWQMNNEMMFCYEFAETWSDIHKGCFEPMSDRLLAHTKVEVVEDNRVRKVVKYHYALINPDYQAPYAGGAYPEVDEYYTLYPDGVGVRRIEFIQKSNNLYKYHELSEPMVISGSSTTPLDHIKSPAMVVSNLLGVKYDLHPAKPYDDVNNNVKNWSEQIYRARLQAAPDVFCVFSYTPERVEVSPLRIENDFSWHDTKYQMSHWPVDKQRYLGARGGDYDKSSATWPSQVSHTSLIGIEAKGDTSWTTAYQTNGNGDKYRVYLMLFGVVTADNSQFVDRLTRSWLYGSVSDLTGAKKGSTTGYSKREMVITAISDKVCFKYNTGGDAANPVFRIDNWSGSGKITLKIDGSPQSENSDYISEKIGGSLVIWINKQMNGTITITVE